MARARELGETVLGTHQPQPRRWARSSSPPDGTLVGEGATAPPGGPHAEVTALAQAGERARGGTVVVTLEPCAHTGRTGPCADALIAAGVARVVVAVPEPTGLAGGGVGPAPGRRGRRRRSASSRPRPRPGALAAWLTGVREHRPFVDLEGRGHPRRPGRRRRRQQPLDHRRDRRAPRSTGCGRPATPSSSARARRCRRPAADRARRRRHAPPPGSRCAWSSTAAAGCRPTARVRDDAAPTLVSRAAGPGRSCWPSSSTATSGGCCSRAGRTGRRLPPRRPGRRGRACTWPRSCSAPGPPSWATWESARSAAR